MIRSRPTRYNWYPLQLLPVTTGTHHNWYPLQLVPVTTGTRYNCYPLQLVSIPFTSTYRLLINKVMTLAAIECRLCSLKEFKGVCNSGSRSLERCFFRHVVGLKCPIHTLFGDSCTPSGTPRSPTVQYHRSNHHISLISSRWFIINRFQVSNKIS